MEKKKIDGVAVASITPFTQGGMIDEKALKQHVEFLGENGIDGIFASGTYGEGPLLSTENHVKFDKIVVQAANNQMFVMIQIGAPATRIVLEQARIAEDAGVDAIAAVPAYYYTHDEASIYSYYQDIASSTTLPVYIYNNPFRTGFNIDLSFLEKLSEIDNLVGVKDSSNDLILFCKYRSVVKPDFKLIMGNDDLALPGLLMGADGIIVVLGNVFPEMFVKLYRAFKNGDYESTVEMQYRILRFREILKKGPYISTYKKVMKLLGRNGGYVRKPLREVTPEEEKNLKKTLKLQGLI